MLAGTAAGLCPALLPTVGTSGRDITIVLAWWSLGMFLALMYFAIVYWFFGGKVPQTAEGYGH
jgi:cytochrome d ubiquinol oxidase subunit II